MLEVALLSAPPCLRRIRLGPLKFEDPPSSGFVFYALRAGAARLIGRVGSWPFWAVRRSCKFGDLGSQ